MASLPPTPRQNKEVRGDDRAVLSWVAPEYPRQERGRGWYGAIAIIALSLGIGALFYENYLLAALIVVAAFALFVQSLREPREVRFTISPRGVTVDGSRHSYDSLRSFWIANADDENPKLIVDAERLFVPHFVILLPEGVDPYDVRAYLGEYLEESDAEHEPFAHAVMEKLGF